jgi:hypothetical protein
MFQLKPISKDAIPRALEKAERYRLLNEPKEAESICLDIIQVDPENQQALITLLLALTDQFEANSPQTGVRARARELLAKLSGEYERAYYAGIIHERKARAQLKQGFLGAGSLAYEGFREAMDWYERAESIRPPGNDDAELRWNCCARAIMEHKLEARREESPQPMLE